MKYFQKITSQHVKSRLLSSVATIATLGSFLIAPSNAQSVINQQTGPLSGGGTRANADLFYAKTTLQEICKLTSPIDGQLAAYQTTGNQQTIASFNPGGNPISGQNPRPAKISASSPAGPNKYKLRFRNAQLVSPNGASTSTNARLLSIDGGTTLVGQADVIATAATMNGVEVNVSFVNNSGFEPEGQYTAKVEVTCLAN